MERLTFAPLIDLPLVGITVVAFIWHFNRWAFRCDIDTSVDVASRLPTARIRVLGLFAFILLAGWYLDFAVWAVFALLVCIGLVVSLIVDGDIMGGAFGLWVAASMIREWSFGFPQLILHPETDKISAVSPTKETGELIGKTGVTTSPLRPTGDVEIEGVSYSAASADGRLLDAGTTVTVTAYRNGRPCVSPVLQTEGLG